MSKKKSRTFMCDFETTVYDNQDYTEVWASACVELYTEDGKETFYNKLKHHIL